MKKVLGDISLKEAKQLYAKYGKNIFKTAIQDAQDVKTLINIISCDNSLAWAMIQKRESVPYKVIDFMIEKGISLAEIAQYLTLDEKQVRAILDKNKGLSRTLLSQQEVSPELQVELFANCIKDRNTDFNGLKDLIPLLNISFDQALYLSELYPDLTNFLLNKKEYYQQYKEWFKQKDIKPKLVKDTKIEIYENEFYTKLLAMMKQNKMKSVTPTFIRDWWGNSIANYPEFKELSNMKEITLDFIKAKIKKKPSDKLEVQTINYLSNQAHYNEDFITFQLNFKEEYLQKFFGVHPEFEDFYYELARYLKSHFHILPLQPGKNFGWVRVEPVKRSAWLITEIQTDWVKLRHVLKNTEKFSHLIDSDQKKEWLEHIAEEILTNFESMAMSAILGLARRNRIKHIYMVTPDNQPGNIGNDTKKHFIYGKIPKKFRFHKVEVDLGLGTDTYWYRLAKVSNSNHSSSHNPGR